MFVFDLETDDDQEFAEVDAADLVDVNRLRDRWYRDLPQEEIEIKRDYFIVFDKSFGNPVMDILEIFSQNYEGDERTYIDNEGDEIVSSCRNLLLAQNLSGFDGWVVLTSLDKEIKDLKIERTARGSTSFSFRCGVEIVNSVEEPQYLKLTRTNSHISGS